MTLTFDLKGADGNVYVLIGKAKTALEAAADEDVATQYAQQATAYDNYDDVVILTMETLDEFGVEHNL